MSEFTTDILTDFHAATSHEWLETNGLGGFSASTIIGLNIRRYHGLLTAATKPPVGRIVMLNKLEEVLVVNGERYELSANQYPGAIHPQGFKYQTGFRLDPFPVFTYMVADLLIEKSVFMVHGQNTTVVQYDVTALNDKAIAFKLEVRPLIAFRDYHSTTHENSAINSNIDSGSGLTAITPYPDLPTLYFSHDKAVVDTNSFWYRNFQYLVERERGLDFAEDLFSPFALAFDISQARQRFSLIVSTEPHEVADADCYRGQELKRRSETSELHKAPFIASLIAAADQFIVARGDQKTVIAGYHWFSDWGRDTMIALPGLTLATGRYEIAKQILLEFSKHIDQGMLPNRFPDAGQTPEYNTVDATLWFFEAVRALVECTSDYEFVRKNLYGVLQDIVYWHVRGTRYEIRVDNDGLLHSGEPGVQLTWMDAKIGDRVVTPRQGKPVEIQALWYNALRIMEHFANKFSDEIAETKYAAMADKASEGFNRLFWNEATNCLYDVVDGSERDSSIRPNQLFALSLEHSMVSSEHALAILDVVERELLTPRGLRSLAKSDSRYRGRYEGGPTERDSVYHQGTVWPWLIGAYLTSVIKTKGPGEGKQTARNWLTAFADHLNEGCLGQVAEIFDGDEPFTPRGCAAQAWSVAEILRVTIEAFELKTGCKGFDITPTSTLQEVAAPALMRS